MLEQGEHVVGGLEGDHHRLDDPGPSAKRPEVLIDVAGAAALVEDLHALAGPHDHDVVFLVQAAEEGGDRYAGGVGQARERGEARRCLAVLDLGHHAEGDLGDLGELRHRQAEVATCITDTLADHPTDVVR